MAERAKKQKSKSKKKKIFVRNHEKWRPTRCVPRAMFRLQKGKGWVPYEVEKVWLLILIFFLNFLALHKKICFHSILSKIHIFFRYFCDSDKLDALKNTGEDQEKMLNGVIIDTYLSLISSNDPHKVFAFSTLFSDTFMKGMFANIDMAEMPHSPD